MKNNFFRIAQYLFVGVILVVMAGCQGRPSAKPPIHIVPDMDAQPKFKPQSRNPLFSDGSAMRSPIDGTVARGQLNEDVAYYYGKDANDEFVVQSPVKITETGLKRGQERYNIYCTPCHGRTGDGVSIMVEKGLVPPPSFHSELIRNYTDGQIFNAISEGIRNMPAYKAQIPVQDRWLIVHYLRALQRSQHAQISDIPPSDRAKLR